MLDKAKFKAYHCIISMWESWGPWCTNQLVDREREIYFYFRLKVRNAKCIWQMLSKNCQMYLSKMQNVYYSISFASTTCGSQGPLMQQPIGRESQLYFRFQAFRNLLSSSNWSKNVDSTSIVWKSVFSSLLPILLSTEAADEFLHWHCWPQLLVIFTCAQLFRRLACMCATVLQMARAAQVPEEGEEAQTIRKLCHQVPN